MAHPVLEFCPYLPLNKSVEFADWEIGPINAFEGRWADAAFEKQARAFLAKFVDGSGKAIEKPSLLCRRGQQNDGALPTSVEIHALEAAIAFAFLDQNPRYGPKAEKRSWAVVTSDNTEVYF